MQRPTRAQRTVLGLIAACSVTLLPIADAYRLAAALAGIVLASVLYRQLGATQHVAADDARAELPVAGEQPRTLKSTHKWLMTLRPMSQLVRLFVIPEIDRRIAAGVLSEKDLPFRLVQFRWIQTDGSNTIELNEEVKLQAKVKTTRPVEAGEPLKLSDIDPQECCAKVFAASIRARVHGYGLPHAWQ